MAEQLASLAAYWPSAAAFGLFGLLHSLGAREPCKEALARWSSRFVVEHYWRLPYCALSYAWLYHVVGPLHWGVHPENDIWLVVYPYWMWQAVTVVHIGSIALIYVAFIQSDYLEFLGLRQAWRGLAFQLGRVREPAPLALFGTGRLETCGVYRLVRHPMLAGGLLFLLTSGPSLNNLVFTLMYLGYMVAGGYYEEQRLIRIFGDDYRDYRRRVGAYLPRLPAHGR